VISFGIAKGEHRSGRFKDVDALFLSIEPLHPVNPPIAFSEMEERFGKKLAMNRAVKTLTPAELKKLGVALYLNRRLWPFTALNSWLEAYPLA
jgi:hypothetical protein